MFKSFEPTDEKAMRKADLIRKLTSRKLWAAVVAFTTSLMLALGADAGTVERVTGIIMSGASLIAYIIGEGLADAGGGVSYTSGLPVWDAPMEPVEGKEPQEADPENGWD